eukprot:1157498-Pelagomonas_calceolata.AAC.5
MTFCTTDASSAIPTPHAKAITGTVGFDLTNTMKPSKNVLPVESRAEGGAAGWAAGRAVLLFAGLREGVGCVGEGGAKEAVAKNPPLAGHLCAVLHRGGPVGLGAALHEAVPTYRMLKGIACRRVASSTEQKSSSPVL